MVLKMHFLNVGHGDCCIVEFPERTTMVDINRSKTIDEESVKEIITAISREHPKRMLNHTKMLKSLSMGESDSKTLLEEAEYKIKPQDPIEYLAENNIKSFHRFISTHAHMDHLRDFGVLNETAEISNVWVVKNSFGSDKDLDKESRQNDWAAYTKFRDSDADSTREEKGSSPTTVLRPMENTLEDAYAADGIKILSPNPELLEKAETNKKVNVMSYVLLIQYGPHKIILGGDAEKPNWKYITNQYGDLIKDVTILKASHHGRDTGFYEKAVEVMNPQYTIVSVGDTLKPSVDAIEKYQQYTKNLLTTRWKGNITIECHENGDIVCNTQHA
jgi:competence protein ComEC